MNLIVVAIQLNWLPFYIIIFLLFVFRYHNINLKNLFVLCFNILLWVSWFQDYFPINPDLFFVLVWNLIDFKGIVSSQLQNADVVKFISIYEINTSSEVVFEELLNHFFFTLRSAFSYNWRDHSEGVLSWGKGIKLGEDVFD